VSFLKNSVVEAKTSAFTSIVIKENNAIVFETYQAA
jgi:hypothetical protein